MLSRRLVTPPRAHFSTLRSSRLTSSDWVDFSSKYYARARYTPTADSAVCHIPYHLPDGADIVPPGQRLRFPAGAAGFLYAHTVPGHPAAGQVRLRCVPHADPTAFAAGHDLLLATGLPWAVPFFALGSGAVAPLRACLLAEALVARADLAHWAKGRTRGRTAAVHTPGEPFFYNFAHPTPHLAVLHGRDVHPMRFMPLGGTAFARPAPYTGSAHLVFEYEPGARAFLLRVRRIISPVVPNPAYVAPLGRGVQNLVPKEGEVLMKPSGSREPRPRLLDPRLRTYHALRFLMPAEERRVLEREMGLETEA